MTEAVVANSPIENPATAFMICANGGEGKEKSKVAPNFFPKSVAMIVGQVDGDDGVVGVGKGGDVFI